MSLLPVAVALLVTQPTPGALTPDGAATLRASWLGALPAVVFPPRVVVRWRVQVGEGSAAGPVALRVLTGNTLQAEAKAVQRGPTEWLPAEPGVYEFPARLRFLNGQALGLDQQTGRHAVVSTTDHSEHAIDVWRPPLGEGETRAGYERAREQRLLVVGEMEYDLDRDGYGDKTQDENDLAIAARVQRRAVRVTLRNRGTRPVHLPHVLVRMRGARLLNRSRFSGLRDERGYLRVSVRRIPPRGRRSVLIRASRPGFRAKLIAGSEGFDPTRSRVVVRARSG